MEQCREIWEQMEQCQLRECDHNTNLESAEDAEVHQQGFHNRNKRLWAAENSLHVRALNHRQMLPHT